MLEEKWKNMYCLVVYDKFATGNDEFVDEAEGGIFTEWSIYLKSRSNPHPGEPNMKLMVCRDGSEVAQFTDVFRRGYGHYENNEKLLPGPVRKAAKKIWKDLEKGKYTDDVLAEIRENFIEKYEARERRAAAALAMG